MEFNIWSAKKQMKFLESYNYTVHMLIQYHARNLEAILFYITQNTHLFWYE